jgi:hypothetical protein
MLCQRSIRSPRMQQPSIYCCWNSERRDPLASYIGVSCCNAHGSQTDLRLARIVFRINFSKSLFVVDRSLTGRKFSGNFGFLPGFGRAMILAFFQGDGKSQSLRQWLNRRVTWTRDLSGRCLRHSFGKPSIPQAFPSFKDQLSFETSHDRNWTHNSGRDVFCALHAGTI